MAQESETQRSTSGIAHAAKRKWGYDAAQVDSFLERAHSLYEGDGVQLTQHDIQNVSFDLKKGGYVITQVDAALSRLERAVIDKQTQWEITQHGRVAWKAQTEQLYRAIAQHAQRDHGARFTDGHTKQSSYDRGQVDNLIDQIVEKCATQISGAGVQPDAIDSLVDVTASTVANVVFTQRRGKRGYDERQVDNFLNACVNLLSRLESYERVADYMTTGAREETRTGTVASGSSSGITSLFGAAANHPLSVSGNTGPEMPESFAPSDTGESGELTANSAVPAADAVSRDRHAPAAQDSYDALHQAEQQVFGTSADDAQTTIVQPSSYVPEPYSEPASPVSPVPGSQGGEHSSASQRSQGASASTSPAAWSREQQGETRSMQAAAHEDTQDTIAQPSWPREDAQDQHFQEGFGSNDSDGGDAGQTSLAALAHRAEELRQHQPSGNNIDDGAPTSVVRPFQPAAEDRAGLSTDHPFDMPAPTVSIPPFGTTSHSAAPDSPSHGVHHAAVSETTPHAETSDTSVITPTFTFPSAQRSHNENPQTQSSHAKPETQPHTDMPQPWQQSQKASQSSEPEPVSVTPPDVPSTPVFPAVGETGEHASDQSASHRSPDSPDSDHHDGTPSAFGDFTFPIVEAETEHSFDDIPDLSFPVFRPQYPKDDAASSSNATTQSPDRNDPGSQEHHDRQGEDGNEK